MDDASEIALQADEDTLHAQFVVRLKRVLWCLVFAVVVYPSTYLVLRWGGFYQLWPEAGMVECRGLGRVLGYAHYPFLALEMNMKRSPYRGTVKELIDAEGKVSYEASAGDGYNSHPVPTPGVTIFSFR